MSPWWDQWPGRLESELARFEVLGLEFQLDELEKANGRIVLSGQIALAGDETVRVVIVFPDAFPHTRFEIFTPDLDLPRHQNPFSKNVCLIPRGSDNWRPSWLAADILSDRLPELISLVRGDPEQLRENEDPQGEPFSDYYSYLPDCGVLIDEPALDIPGDRGKFQLTQEPGSPWINFLENETPNDGGLALLAQVSVESAPFSPVAHENLTKIYSAKPREGTWVRLDEPPHGTLSEMLTQAVEKDPSLRSVLGKRRKKRGKGQISLVGLVFDEEVQQGIFETAWVFLVVRPVWKRGGRVDLESGLIRGLRYSSSHLAERIPELSSLREAHVAVAGLGSLGAPIAIQLAQSQVGQLSILDADYVDPATTVRWPLGLDSAPLGKVQALKRHIDRNYPFVEVDGSMLHVGATSLERPGIGEAEILAQWLAHASVVIDATVETNVSRTIAYQAHPAGLPQIYVWSIDGYGGVVARILPGTTGCFECLERALADGRIPPPLEASNRAHLDIQPRGCADRTFAGAAPDLVPLANEAVRMVFGLKSAETDDGYPAFADDVLVAQFRSPDGTPIPPDWHGYVLTPGAECELCQQAPV